MNEQIIADLKSSYGLVCGISTPVEGGFMHLKWKVSTNQGDMLVKQFSHKRYKQKGLMAIEAALQMQILLQKKGIPCPTVLTCNGGAIRFLDDETSYMVMTFSPGRIESPDTITTKQMHSLGSTCGRMRKAYAKLPVERVKGYPIDSNTMLDSLWANYHTRMQEDPGPTPSAYQKAVRDLEPILQKLTPDFFERFPKGIGHEDFSPDNMLFDEEGVTAILDFDRTQYGFIWHDIGRALLSFALKDGKIDREKVDAFCGGYAQYAPLTPRNIADALRISWCIETLWWIHPECFSEKRGKVRRFRDEILWLTVHWFELDELISS